MNLIEKTDETRVSFFSLRGAPVRPKGVRETERSLLKKEAEPLFLKVYCTAFVKPRRGARMSGSSGFSGSGTISCAKSR